MLVKNLPEQIGLNIKPEIKALFLYCAVCGSKYSANKGDYWNRSDNDDLMCCEESLDLCRQETHIIPV
jgi:hypothetical protein